MRMMITRMTIKMNLTAMMIKTMIRKIMSSHKNPKIVRLKSKALKLRNTESDLI